MVAMGEPDPCREPLPRESRYLHCAKKVLAAHYKLDTEDPAACARMEGYFLKEDRFNCSPNGYEVTFSASFFQTISVRR